MYTSSANTVKATAQADDRAREHRPQRAHRCQADQHGRDHREAGKNRPVVEVRRARAARSCRRTDRSAARCRPVAWRWSTTGRGRRTRRAAAPAISPARERALASGWAGTSARRRCAYTGTPRRQGTRGRARSARASTRSGGHDAAGPRPTAGWSVALPAACRADHRAARPRRARAAPARAARGTERGSSRARG